MARFRVKGEGISGWNLTKFLISDVGSLRGKELYFLESRGREARGALKLGAKRSHNQCRAPGWPERYMLYLAEDGHDLKQPSSRSRSRASCLCTTLVTHISALA